MQPRRSEAFVLLRAMVALDCTKPIEEPDLGFVGGRGLRARIGGDAGRPASIAAGTPRHGHGKQARPS